MHNVLVLWYRFIIKENFKGANFLVVYADDFIAGFELESEAKQYYELLQVFKDVLTSVQVTKNGVRYDFKDMEYYDIFDNCLDYVD